MPISSHENHNKTLTHAFPSPLPDQPWCFSRCWWNGHHNPELGDTAMNKGLTWGGLLQHDEMRLCWGNRKYRVDQVPAPGGKNGALHGGKNGWSNRVILCGLSTSLIFPTATSSSHCSSPTLTHTGENETGVSFSPFFLISLYSLTSSAGSPPPSQQRTH